ncbi:MAG: STAS domain-containing protein [Pseudomonadales bacterium]|nr:STAS domain-containing protein [Pseudomonadales bacterium]
MKIKKLKGSNKPKGICKLALEGDMTIYTAESIHADFKPILQDYSRFEISLAGVEDIDTTGVQMLLALSNHAEAEGHTLKMDKPSESVQEIANLFNISKRLNLASV